MRTHTKFGIKIFEIYFVIEIKWYLTFWPLPTAQGAGPKKNYVAHPIHVSNSHTKFGWISSNGLGGDSITDGRTDRRTKAITISPSLFLKKRGDNKGVRALRGYFSPLWGQKIKVALHKFLLISLLEQQPKNKGLRRVQQCESSPRARWLVNIFIRNV